MAIERVLSFLILGVIAQLLSYCWIRCGRGKRGGAEKENQKAKGKCQKAKVIGVRDMKLEGWASRRDLSENFVA
jgi:hypothetical protein